MSTQRKLTSQTVDEKIKTFELCQLAVQLSGGSTMDFLFEHMRFAELHAEPKNS